MQHSRKLYSVSYIIRDILNLKFNEISLSFVSLIVIIINALKLLKYYKILNCHTYLKKYIFHFYI